MKSIVQISRGIESLFGTRDENIRLIEDNLQIRTRLLNDSLELEGDEASVARAAQILNDYVALMREGHTFNNGDLNSFLRVVTADADTSLRSLVESGKQRTFGKKVIAPKSMKGMPRPKRGSVTSPSKPLSGLACTTARISSNRSGRNRSSKLSPTLGRSTRSSASCTRS